MSYLITNKRELLKLMHKSVTNIKLLSISQSDVKFLDDTTQLLKNDLYEKIQG